MKEEILHLNGNMIFNRTSPLKNGVHTKFEEKLYESTIEINHNSKEKPSPTMSSKSNRSYKFPNPARSDLFSENDTTQQQRRKYD